MISIRSTLVSAVCIAASLPQTNADICGPAYHAEVAAAVQILHVNCASWHAYLASGGVWNCDSTCQDAVVNLVDTLPDCTYGGPYGQNYKEVVKSLAERCDAELSDSADTTTTAPSEDVATSTTNDSSEKLRTGTSSGTTVSTSVTTKLLVGTMLIVGMLQI